MEARNSFLSGEISLQEILEVQEYFGLPSPALVEKDYQVVRALAAIHALDVAPLRLVFQGGTALSRAHRLTRRMSEDIDLRIVSETPPTRAALRRLREKISGALVDAGFGFYPNNSDQVKARNESRYTLYRLPYDPVSRGEGALRPEIQIETAVWPLRTPPLQVSVSSFVAEAFGRPPEIPLIECVSVAETIADKFVAMTRRIAEELRLAEGDRDPTVVRHVYDMHAVRDRYEIAEVVTLIPAIMKSDVEAYGNRFPAYRENPMRETVRALEALADDPFFARSYAYFHRSMVYGDPVEFDVGLATLDLIRRAILLDRDP